MNPRQRRTITGFLLLLGIPAPLFAGTPYYSVQMLDLECGTECVPLLGDFDGDGQTDLLVWNGEGLRLYAERRGTFVPVGEQQDLPKGTRLFDVGDADGDGVDDLIYLTPSGVFFAHLEDVQFGPTRQWVSATCDLPGRYVGPAQLVSDIDGNGRDDVWFIEDGHLRIHLVPLPGQLVAVQPLPLVSAGRRVEPKGLPFRVFLGDVDEDDAEDLLCMTPDGVSAFRAGAGCFDASSGWYLPFEPYLEEKDAREIVDQRLDDISHIKDVTGDGHPDLFLSSWSRGEVLMFLGDDDFFEDEPAQVLEPGAVITQIGSLSREGFDRPGLVVSRFTPPGKVSAALRLLTGGKITIKVHFFLYEPDEASEFLYLGEPAVVREIASYAKRKDFGATSPYLLFQSRDGDFDGDGWNDLVVMGDSTTVAFYWARAAEEFGRSNGRGLRAIFSRPDPEPMPIARFFEWSHQLILERAGARSPDLEVPVPSACGYAVDSGPVADLNGDGWPDLVLPYHPADDSRPFKLVILLTHTE